MTEEIPTQNTNVNPNPYMVDENPNVNPVTEAAAETTASASPVSPKVIKPAKVYNKIKIDMTKEEYNKVKQEYLKDKADQKSQVQVPQKNPISKFFKWRKRMAMNKSLKKADEVLVFLLNLKKQIEGPILTKIYGGNFMVIRNHVYRYNPDKIFSFGKYKSVIAREFDRELVGVDDYQELIGRDMASGNPGQRVNINDPVLIKALIAARLSEKPIANTGNAKWVILGLLAVGLIIGFFMTKKSP